jgi:fatty acid desaturase
MSSQELLTSLFLIVNSGLVVLIWMVQLIVYPSFLFYNKENLVQWHNIYTKRIAVIVVPLMLIQLVISILNTIVSFSIINLTISLLVLFLWVFTFTSFAPLHFKISENRFQQTQLQQLVNRNWIRTIIWSLILGLSLL